MESAVLSSGGQEDRCHSLSVSYMLKINHAKFHPKQFHYSYLGKWLALSFGRLNWIFVLGNARCFCTAKNWDICTGLVCPRVHSLRTARFTLAHCCTHSFARSLAHAQAERIVWDIMTHVQAVPSHSSPIPTKDLELRATWRGMARELNGRYGRAKDWAMKQNKRANQWVKRAQDIARAKRVLWSSKQLSDETEWASESMNEASVGWRAS